MHAALLVSTPAEGCQQAVAGSGTIERHLRVVAAGSGTKCLPGSRRSACGDLVCDCHAEVLARRAMVSWLHGEAELAVREHQRLSQLTQRGETSSGEAEGTVGASRGNGESRDNVRSTSLLKLDPRSGRFTLLPGTRVHMYVSQPPCGDACVVRVSGGLADGSSDGGPLTVCGCGRDEVGGGAERVAKRERPSECEEDEREKATLVFRTGAKLIKPKLESTVPLTNLSECGNRQATAPICHSAEGDSLNSKHQRDERPRASESISVPTASDVEPGAQEEGVARRKPGKVRVNIQVREVSCFDSPYSSAKACLFMPRSPQGDPTLSMSCSDKIAKWACLGLQGCLLSALLTRPVALDTVTVSALREISDAGNKGKGCKKSAL